MSKQCAKWHFAAIHNLIKSESSVRFTTAHRLWVVSHAPHPNSTRSLLGMLGICVAVSGVVMAPVPILGPLLSGIGMWSCWMGRTGDFATGARICLGVNSIAFCIGMVITSWFVYLHW